jgi:hypothetical protein
MSRSGLPLALLSVGALALAASIRTRSGSFVTYNPYAGKRTMGPPVDLVNRMMRAVYGETVSHPGEARAFPSGTRIAGLFHVQRADGQDVTVLLLVESSDDPDRSVEPEGGVGTYHGSPIVLLRLASRVRISWSTWEGMIRPVLAHEVTHLMDPGRSSPKRAGAPRSKGDKVWRPSTDTEWRTYVNAPAEVIARRHEARVEIEHSPMMETARRMLAGGDFSRGRIAELMLLASTTWREVRKDLTPKNKRIFYEMSASLLSELESA